MGAAPAVPVPILLSKYGDIDYDVPICMNGVLATEPFFLVSQCRDILGLSAPEFAAVLTAAIDARAAGASAKIDGLQRTAEESRFMAPSDMEAIESICFPHLKRTVVAEISLLHDLRIVKDADDRGIDLWLPRGVFFGTLLPASTRTFAGTPYGRWLAHLLDYAVMATDLRDALTL
jgi:hypothetical protein